MTDGRLAPGYLPNLVEVGEGFVVVRSLSMEEWLKQYTEELNRESEKPV